MPTDLLVLAILAGALVLFVTGWVRMDLVALLVLGTLAVTGLVTPEQALAGFSSPAVVTVWAMFVLSAGLARAGVPHLLARPLLRLARGTEATLIAGIMVAAALLSALINTVTVAALLLPVVMDIARRSGRPPSRLLLPLALGSLLGGPFTAISTPPNILIADFVRGAGLEPLGLFDFTPMTAAIVTAGIGFVVLLGRRVLPAAPLAASPEARGGLAGGLLGSAYRLPELLFGILVEDGSALVGRTLAASRLGSALQLNVVGIWRRGRLHLAPEPETRLEAGDRLVVHGSPERLETLRGRRHLLVESTAGAAARLASGGVILAEASLGLESPLAGRSVAEAELRRRLGVNLLALQRGPEILRTELQHRVLEPGDVLLLQGRQTELDALGEAATFDEVKTISEQVAVATYRLEGRLLRVHVPEGSLLSGRKLADSRLGDAFGLTVLGIVRGGETQLMPHPDERIAAGDALILQGTPEDLQTLAALQSLKLEPETPERLAELESQGVGAAEVVLSPRTSVAGRTLRELRFRALYGLTVLAVWRNGRPHLSGLRDLTLRFGDALLVYGHRRSLQELARDPDFLVLDQTAIQAPRLERLPVASAILLGVLVSALAGWVPVAIAAVCGAALMVLSRCLTMEEAYRAIDWQAVFLIAGMLPLGTAVQHSGLAVEIAQTVMAGVGPLGPRAVVAALFLLTVLATQVIPTAALVVLMAPVALDTALALGLSPHLLLMTVAFAASASFASPVSHPANVLVMGPGGYRFLDYLRVGGPLTAVVLALAVVLLPLFWPP